MFSSTRRVPKPVINCAESSQPCTRTQALADPDGDGELTCVDIPCTGGGEINDRKECECPPDSRTEPDENIPGGADCVDPCEDGCPDDDNDCTSNECVVGQVDGKPTRNCPYNAVPDGAMCMDQGMTGECMAGQCEVEPLGECDDGNPCTVDGIRNEETGVCPDSTFASAGTACADGICDGEGSCVECVNSNVCADDNDCTDDVCAAETGTCVRTAKENDTQCIYQDGDGVCEDGECVAPSLPCQENPCPEDDNECTQTRCVPEGDTRSCVSDPVADDVPCTTSGLLKGTCEAGECVELCAGVDCTSSRDCVADGTCDDATGFCVDGDNRPKDTKCDDDGGRACDGNGKCIACTQDSQCPDPEPGNICIRPACANARCESAFRDAVQCTASNGAQGRCSLGECIPSDLCATVDCSDGDPCTQDLCDDTDGTCSNPPENNGFGCSAGGFPGTCQNGACVGLCDGETCDDGDACTIDGACNPQTGQCSAGTNAVCDDMDACTTNSCDSPDGCRYVFKDGDGDGYSPDTCRSGGAHTGKGDDCHDGLAIRNPGVTAFFERASCIFPYTQSDCQNGTVPGSNSRATYDYNCDGTEEKRYPVPGINDDPPTPTCSRGICFCSGSGFLSPPSLIPECGELYPVFIEWSYNSITRKCVSSKYAKQQPCR